MSGTVILLGMLFYLTTQSMGVIVKKFEDGDEAENIFAGNYEYIIKKWCNQDYLGAGNETTKKAATELECKKNYEFSWRKYGMIPNDYFDQDFDYHVTNAKCIPSKQSDKVRLYKKNSKSTTTLDAPDMLYCHVYRVGRKTKVSYKGYSIMVAKTRGGNYFHMSYVNYENLLNEKWLPYTYSLLGYWEIRD